MATGQVSSISDDNWQLVATNTTTSGTTFTFSSLSGYKKYMLVWDTIVTTANSQIYLTFNSSSTNYSGVSSGDGLNSGLYYTSRINLSAYNNTLHAGHIYIDYVNQTAPKIVDGHFNDNSVGGFVKGMWNGGSAVTSIVITSSSAFTSGSVSLYGIAA